MSQNLEARFERCCRLCAEEQDVTIMIFSKEAEAMLLQNKLNNYLLIEVDEDDKLPKNICIPCCTKLQTVCDFIDTARKAQEILQNRSLVLDNMITNELQVATIKSEPVSDDEVMVTGMEVNVDPMMVLQNSEDIVFKETNNESLPNGAENITNLNGLDGEFVTIKLIKRGEKPADSPELPPPNEEKKDVKPFPCPTCRRSFFTELALKNHSWIHINEEKSAKRYRCQECHLSFDYKCDLISHVKVHRSSGMCQLCKRVFRSEANLKAHLQLHLQSGRSYTCKVCGRSYSTRSNLTTHSVTHSNDRPYKCHLCKKSFKRNQDLKFHINQHTGAKPYKCPFCDKSFASSGNCYSHRSRMHPGRRVENSWRRAAVSAQKDTQSQARTSPKLVLNKGIFKYQCQYCDHSFMRRDNYTYHMYQHTGQKPFQCTFCVERFVTRKGLLLHHDKEHPSHDRPLALLSKNVLLK